MTEPPRSPRRTLHAAAEAPRSPGRSPARGSLSPARLSAAEAPGSPARTARSLDDQAQRGTPKRLRVKGPDEWPVAPGTPVRASPTPPRLATAASQTPPRGNRSQTPPPRRSLTPTRVASPGRVPPALALGGSGDGHTLGFIQSLTVENFKSYEGVHSIGPFDKFCCVIGPNGSGKSNVMDAISFCLGIRAKHLRGDRLKDLVYRREEESAEANPRSARVTIHFQSGRGEMIAFERIIRVGGESSYRYGTSTQQVKACSYDQFIRHLADEHIFVKARNFLVFQGDVMDLARRQGTDLSGVLETISGSDQLRESYESLLSELEITQEKARMHFQHLTEIRQTVLQLQKQREVVERFQALSAEKIKVLTEMNLFKLFGYFLEAQKSKGEHAQAMSEVSELDKAGRALGKEITETEGKYKTTHKDMEKAWNAKIIFGSNAEYQKPSLANCMKTVEHYTKKKKQVLKEIEDQSKDNAGVEAKLSGMKTEHKGLQAKILELRAKVVPTVHFTQRQRQLYDEACIKSESNNLRAREQRREAEEQLRQLRHDAHVDGQVVRDLEERGDHGERKLQAIAAERAELDKQIKDIQAEEEQGAQSIEMRASEDQRNQGFRDTLKEEERSILYQLDLHKTKRERLEKTETKLRLAQELRAAFPESVIGRVSELVVPSQKRFELALQTALASRADAFVVTHHKAGVRCINYLKEKRIGAEVFLPLDRLKVQEDSEKLHGLTQGHQARRLAEVCVKHNEKFLEQNPQWQEHGSQIIDQVMKSLLGGTVIVDDLTEARSVAFRDAPKRKLTLKTVSLNGEVILPNGNMEVKSSNSMGLMEFGGVEELNKMRQAEKRIQDIQADLRVVEEQIAGKRAAEADFTMQCEARRSRLKEVQEQLVRVKSAEKLEKKAQEAKKERIQELQAKAKKHTNMERKLAAAREEAEGELLQRGKKFFAALSAELGVPDVQALMLQEDAGRKQRQQELEEHEDRLRECQGREQGLSERLKDNQRVASLRLDHDGFVQKIKEEEARAKEIKARIESFEQNHVLEEKRHRQLKEQTEELAAKLSDLKVGVQELKEKREASVERAKKTNEKAHNVLAYSCRVLRDCREQSVDIPFRCYDDAQYNIITSRAHVLDEQPLEDLQSAFEMVKVDFTNLNESKALEYSRCLESTDVHEVAQAIDREHEERIMEIKRGLDSLNPNMSAKDEHQLEAEKLEEIKRQGDEAAARVTELEAKFEDTKAQRTARFMNCFKHVEAVVQPFYKELTSYDGYEGGSAYLDLDDAEEPYNGGITFTACPPGKRFFPMELLSGGEKSMASMALLFAMHSYQPPPFMILDEVDAPFDKKNTDSLVRYLQKLKFQCLVISLKDTFFKNSDALVGVYKDKVAQTSGVITLPLSRLGDESQDQAKGAITA